MEYTQKCLRTYLSVLKAILDWNSHTLGTGEETEICSLIVTENLVQSILYDPGLREF